MNRGWQKKGAADYRTERLGLWPQVLLVRGSLALALSAAASGACSAPATPQAGFTCQNCCWIKKLNSFSHHSTSSGQDQDSETDSVWLSGKGFHLFFNPCYLITAFLKAYKCATGEWVKIQRQRDIQLPFWFTWKGTPCCVAITLRPFPHKGNSTSDFFFWLRI